MAAGAPILIVLAAIAVGVMVPAQAGINAELRRHLGSPIVVSAISFVIGLVLLIGASAATRAEVPSLAKLSSAPWWSYLGGAMGAAFVLTGVVAAPRLGAALLVASMVAGQLIGSVVIDHFGWLGFIERPITLARIAGVLLLAGGVFLLQRS